MRKTGFLLIVLTGFALAAGVPPGFVQWTASDVKTVEQHLIQSLGSQQFDSQVLKDFGTHSVQMVYRTGSGEAEIHENLTDVMMVRSGEATLVVGGKAVGARSTAPGEIRGSSIEGGSSRKVAAGDIINIPANTPHQTLLAPGRQVTMLVLKVKARP